ncbi:MAG: GTPase [Cyanobacteriota bacterium]|nr:GTPase [Cyanobacteriota bacterium]
MVRLKPWQWIVLALPIAAIVIFVIIAAGLQIRAWGISWIWGIFILLLLGSRWLLVRWTKPVVAQVEAAIAQVSEELEASTIEAAATEDDTEQQIEAQLQDVLDAAAEDSPMWEDWQTFWTRCQEVVVVVSHIYHPEVKYPLLNIYIPQAYGLMRGTVDDMDRWMQKLSPALGQVSVGKAYEAYEVYRKLEPSARKLWKAWNWAQWVLNPVAAAARTASKESTDRANQQLLVNLSQLLREVALRNLAQQAATLYGGKTLPLEFTPETTTLPEAKTQTLQEILDRAEPTESVSQKPINLLLVGRTGAGKSSLVNTLFNANRAEVDVLPSTDRIQNYRWRTSSGETLNLRDTPGYEQAKRADFRELVLEEAADADFVLLATPALDPALQMDVDFLEELKAEREDLPTFAIVTQVDRLRPVREWNPPYDWQEGDRPKEIAIREATEYRAERLGEFCDRVLPLVTGDRQIERASWNADILSMALVETIDPAKQVRLARFLRDRQSKILAAAKIIDGYTAQMTTTQGLTALLKSPILSFLSTLSTGSPALAKLLAANIPVEEAPLVIGKLQMAYELFCLLSPDGTNPINFNLLAIWPLLLENPSSPDRNAWAFGHALVEYWTQDLSIAKLRERIEFYLEEVGG